MLFKIFQLKENTFPLLLLFMKEITARVTICKTDYDQYVGYKINKTFL